MLPFVSGLPALIIRYSFYGIELLAVPLVVRASWPVGNILARAGRAFDSLVRCRRPGFPPTGLAAQLIPDYIWDTG
jgi:hypothetical protein